MADTAPPGTVYLIVDVSVTDPAKFAAYVKGHVPTVEKYGGRFLVAGGRPEVIEGQWNPRRVIVQEWPSLERFRAWYDSEEYRPWRELRLEAAAVNAIIVHGSAPGQHVVSV